MKSNAQILGDLEAAIKGIFEVNSLGQSVMAEGQLDRFIDEMRAKSVVLDRARFMLMRSSKEAIDRIGFTGRILHGTQTVGAGKGGNSDGAAHRDLETAEYAVPTTATNHLVANEFKAIVPLRDKAMRRALEQGNFESHIIDLMGQAAGRDMEELGLFADKAFTTVEDDALSLTDGWLKLAANKVYGAGTGADFDPTDPEEIFDALIAALPKEFLNDRSQWPIYCTWEIDKLYRDVLKARNTSLGDAAQTGQAPLFYEGHPVIVVPLLDRAKTIANGGPGRVATLQFPDNMVWGLFHEVTVESERHAREGLTYQVLNLEADAGYEDENAAVVAYLDAEDGEIS
jgi:hypothetical protein